MEGSVGLTRSMTKRTRPLAVIAAALVIGIAAPAVSAEAQHGERAFTCMNKSSGATWQIKVDYDHSTVDTNPASISDAKIAWRDAYEMQMRAAVCSLANMRNEDRACLAMADWRAPYCATTLRL